MEGFARGGVIGQTGTWKGLGSDLGGVRSVLQALGSAMVAVGHAWPVSGSSKAWVAVALGLDNIFPVALIPRKERPRRNSLWGYRGRTNARSDTACCRGACTHASTTVYETEHEHTGKRDC